MEEFEINYHSCIFILKGEGLNSSSELSEVPRKIWVNLTRFAVAFCRLCHPDLDD
jgi:hypothetical protein